jgi:ribonuclease D
MSGLRPIPTKEGISQLPLFDRLGLEKIHYIQTEEQALKAYAHLLEQTAWGIDTESKPTFKVGQTSDGPHTLQLATLEQAWVFQLKDPSCCEVAARLLQSEGIVKAGFGLGDDRKRIVRKLGVEPQGILELNTVFRQLGYRQEMGVKAAVAVVFNQNFQKSKKAATSNWANPRLSESQLVYAANDAYAAIKVWLALQG